MLGKLYHWLYKKFEKQYSRRYYQSVEDLPVWNWWKIHETKDLKYLLKQDKKVTVHANGIFDKIYSEFISIFGVGENYKRYLEKLIEIDIAETDKILNNDPSLDTFIDIMKIELDEIKSSTEGGSYMDTAITVEKNMGFKLNTKEISVFEYYSYIKSLEKQSKK